MPDDGEPRGSAYEIAMGRVFWWLLRGAYPALPPYLELLERVHRYLRPRTYLEIGVSTGRSLALAYPDTVSIGVDPAPRPLFPVKGNKSVVTKTSDDFFAGDDLERALGGQPLDLAFVDGMHHFEYALRDFINIERFAGPDTTVLVHDCYPHDERTAQRERVTGFWSGDVWRLVATLKRHRPDLEISVVDVRPTGLGIIRRLDPSSTVLAERYAEIEAEALALPYSYLDEIGKSEALNRVPNDWDVVRALLPSPFRSDPVTPFAARRAASAVSPALRGVYRRGSRAVRRRVHQHSAA